MERKYTHTPQKTLIRVGALWCLFLLILGAYAQVAQHEFVNYDDKQYVSENPFVKSGLPREGIVWSFTNAEVGAWQPLVWLSYMVLVDVFGMQPGPQLVLNAGLHCLNSFLVFFILLRMSGALRRSFFAAALFAVHPIHVESVAWITERKDVLSAFFALLCMLQYLHYQRRPGFRSYLPMMVAFVLSLMAKPMMVTLPCLFLLLDIWPLGRTPLWSAPDGDSGTRQKPIRHLGIEKAPLFVLSSIFCAIAVTVQSNAHALAGLNNISFDARVSNALISYCAYIGKLFWPFNLAVFYPHPGYAEYGKAGLAALFLTLVSLYAIRKVNKYPFFFTGWFWFLGTLFPVIGLVQFGSHGMADRFAYMPFLGLYLIIAWAMGNLAMLYPRLRTGLTGWAVLFLIVLFVLCRQQVSYWRNSTTLFQHAVAATGGSEIAYNNLGAALAADGKLDAAIDQYRAAVRFNHKYVAGYYNMGNAFFHSGKLRSAMECYAEVLRIAPHHRQALFNSGIILERLGKKKAAVNRYKKVLQLNPRDIGSHYRLARLLISKNKLKAAKHHLKTVVRLDPLYTDAYNDLGVISNAEGNRQAAKAYFQKALQLDPLNIDAQSNLHKIKRHLKVKP